MDTALRRKLAVILLAVLNLLDTAVGQTPPFSATATARKSVRITDPITGAASLLTEDSRDLTFQEYAFTDASGVTTFDPRYLAFATKDSSIDDVADRCSGTTKFQVYWLDDYNSSVRCVSANLNGLGVAVQGDGDSVNPKIGGPTDEEGRYVAFETTSSNLFRGKVPTPAIGEPTPLSQIVVHDRKFEQTWLSTSKNLAACQQGMNRSQSLAGMSDDGSNLLFTSAAANGINNLEPQCVALSGFSAEQVYLRDGNNCDNPSASGATGLGECYTKVLFDTYETHAGTNTVAGVDAAAAHPSMTADGSVVVFDSLATTPTKYNPDVSGFYDIYMNKSNKFSVLSRMQSPRCTLTGTLLPIINDGSPANGNSQYPRVDGAGRYVAFQSTATNLVVNTSFAGMTCTPGNTRPASVQYLSTGGFTQIYLYDSVTKKVEMVSTAYSSTGGGNGNSVKPWISRDAHYIIYESSATNLLSTTTTSSRNVFMYDRVQKKTFIVTPGVGGSGLNNDASITYVSNNGLTVAYQTIASDPVAATSSNGGAVGGGNTIQHVYLAQSNCPTDTDTDGVPDCLDLCASDSLKSEPGACGCGKTESDSDADLTPNCIDACPSDANKILAGYCGCGVAETDSDRDGMPDCVDTCPSDSSKTSLGQCGCGVADTDTDLDGTADCRDACPSNPAKSAAGTCACTDLKDRPGDCGCNVADQDSNGNGASDCLDPTAATVGAVPKVDITRTTTDNKKAKYQLFSMLQKFTGRVSYAVTLTQGKKRITKTSASWLVGFNDLSRGTYTLSYTVSVGSGASKVTSKPRTVTIKLPGGVVSSSMGRAR
jgi:hypothetical protein